MTHEVAFILGITEAEFCFVENIAQLKKVASLLDQLPHLATIAVLDRKTTKEQVRDLSIKSDITVLLYSELIAGGNLLLQDSKKRKAIQEAIATGDAEEIATIIFTSGTTGEPKGVMLSHRNLVYQLEAIPKLIRGWSRSSGGSASCRSGTPLSGFFNMSPFPTLRRSLTPSPSVQFFSMTWLL